MAAAVISPKIIQRIIGPFEQRSAPDVSRLVSRSASAGRTLGVLATERLNLF